MEPPVEMAIVFPEMTAGAVGAVVGADVGALVGAVVGALVGAVVGFGAGVSLPPHPDKTTAAMRSNDRHTRITFGGRSARFFYMMSLLREISALGSVLP